MKQAKTERMKAVDDTRTVPLCAEYQAEAS
jgi:hypothetical protein